MLKREAFGAHLLPTGQVRLSQLVEQVPEERLDDWKDTVVQEKLYDEDTGQLLENLDPQLLQDGKDDEMAQCQDPSVGATALPYFIYQAD